jgi:cytochrome c-type biogenesis protein CcmH/NrfG
MAKGSGSDRRVVVTPRMLRAGALALAALGDVSDYEVVGTVYRAMAAVAPQQTKSAEHVPPANFLEVMRLMRSGRRDV